MPIHELLNKIRWDPAFAQAEFTIGYYDRKADTIIIAPLRELHFEHNDHFAFTLVDDDGVAHHIPLHRIREVYRNGQLIWHRPR